MFATSNNSGQNWSTPQVIFLAGRNNELARWGRIAVDERGRLHAVLTYTINDPDARYGRTDANLLYYLRSDDNGGAWTEPFLVTPEPDFGEINVATFGEDVVHLVWNGRAGRHGRYHRWSTDGGQTWRDIAEIIAPAPINPIGNGGLTGFPALAVDNTGRLHMVTTANQGNFYLNWQNNNWSTSTLISTGLTGRGVTGRSGSLEQPSIALSEGNRLHVVFHDGFERIWYMGAVTDALHEMPIPLPTPDIEGVVEPLPTPTEASPIATAVPFVSTQVSPPTNRSNSSPVIASVITVIFLLVIVFSFHYVRPKR